MNRKDFDERDPRMLTAEEERLWRDVKKEPNTREDWEDLFFTIEGYKRRRIERHRKGDRTPA